MPSINLNINPIFSHATFNLCRCAPLSKNAVSAFQISCTLLSFTLKDSWRKLGDDQCSSVTKASVYHIKHMYIQPLITVVDWPEIWCLMEVSVLFYISRYCDFTWYSRDAIHEISNSQTTFKWSKSEQEWKTVHVYSKTSWREEKSKRVRAWRGKERGEREWDIAVESWRIEEVNKWIPCKYLDIVGSFLLT